MRLDKRASNQLRQVEIIPNFLQHAEGSCLIKFGNTHVLCAASVDDKTPPWLKGSGKGWVTAEYGMLPRSTNERMEREAAKGKQSGRTQEIQRLIGRALRAVVDMRQLGERQIKIDCDVIQADGGTRTAAITGGYIALHQACLWMKQQGIIKAWPLREGVAAISCGIIASEAMLDLCYEEDSAAEVDANFVLTASGQLVEIQATGEANTFTPAQFQQMLILAQTGCAQLAIQQQQALALIT